MKFTTQIILGLLFSLFFALSSCNQCNHKADKSKERCDGQAAGLKKGAPLAGPATIAGIVIDGTGKLIVNPHISITITDITGATIGRKESADGSFMIAEQKSSPYTITASDGNANFYTVLDDLDFFPGAFADIRVILNSAIGVPTLDLTFLNNDSPNNIKINITKNGVALPEGMPGADGHFRLPVAAKDNLAIKCSTNLGGNADMNGNAMTRQIKVPDNVTNQTIGYTFFVNR